MSGLGKRDGWLVQKRLLAKSSNRDGRLSNRDGGLNRTDRWLGQGDWRLSQRDGWLNQKDEPLKEGGSIVSAPIAAASRWLFRFVPTNVSNKSKSGQHKQRRGQHTLG